jgi:quercetin dioxygenase-like cupin family protein
MSACRPPPVQIRTVSDWTLLSPGVMSRCLLEEHGTALMLYRMDAGLRFDPHSHLSAELGLVLSGEGRLLLGAESRPVRAGDTFFVGPGVSHGFETFPNGGETVVLNAVCPACLDDPRPLIEAIWGSAGSAARNPATHRPVKPPHQRRRARSDATGDRSDRPA